MATLIDSSRNYSHFDVLIYTADSAADKFIEAVYAISRQQARNRLIIKDGRYMYTPSDEFNQAGPKLIRFKNYKR